MGVPPIPTFSAFASTHYQEALFTAKGAPWAFPPGDLNLVFNIAPCVSCRRMHLNRHEEGTTSGM